MRWFCFHNETTQFWDTFIRINPAAIYFWDRMGSKGCLWDAEIYFWDQTISQTILLHSIKMKNIRAASVCAFCMQRFRSSRKTGYLTSRSGSDIVCQPWLHKHKGMQAFECVVYVYLMFISVRIIFVLCLFNVCFMSILYIFNVCFMAVLCVFMVISRRNSRFESWLAPWLSILPYDRRTLKQRHCSSELFQQVAVNQNGNSDVAVWTHASSGFVVNINVHIYVYILYAYIGDRPHCSIARRFNAGQLAHLSTCRCD